MTIRTFRWLSAGLLAAVAVLGGPSRSEAGTQILVQEFTSSGSLVGGGTFDLNNLPTNNSPFNTGGSFQGIVIGITSTSGAPGDTNSLSTTVTAKPASNFDSGNYLKVTVTDDGFQSANTGSTVVTNDPGLSSGLFNAINQATGKTELSTGTIGSLTPFAETTEATQASGDGDITSTANVASIPSTFAITQTLTIRATPTGGTVTGTFTDTISSTVQSNTNGGGVVPAPAGVILALTAVPVLGLRRVLRRKAAN